MSDARIERMRAMEANDKSAAAWRAIKAVLEHRDRCYTCPSPVRCEEGEKLAALVVERILVLPRDVIEKALGG